MLELPTYLRGNISFTRLPTIFGRHSLNSISNVPTAFLLVKHLGDATDQLRIG